MKANGNVPEKRVLVVDDDRDIIEIAAIILSDSGYQCESATNGADAIRKVRRGKFDAVVTDIGMPGMDGIALTRKLSQQFSGLPVIIMTGKPEDRSKETALHAGASEFLTKPFAGPDLIEKLHRVLLGHKTAKESKENFELSVI